MDEPTIVAELVLNVIVVEDGESNCRFPDPPRANKSNWFEVRSETNKVLDQLVVSETGRGCRGRQLPHKSIVRLWLRIPDVRNYCLGVSLWNDQQFVIG